MTRSDRTTGNYRAYRGSGPVGLLPTSRPGNPAKTRRKTKPLCRGKSSSPEYLKACGRGFDKTFHLIYRAQ